MAFSATIRDYIKSKNAACKVYPAPFAVKLQKNRKTIVEPDISVICDRNKLTDKGCTGAPDWIINPINQSIYVYHLETTAYTFEDTIKVNIYEDLFIDFSELEL